jgi:MOSC domain-containing protein YiiM
MIETAELQCRAGKGICGDRFFGHKENYRGQITFFSAETYEEICRAFPGVQKPPSVFRRNVILADDDLKRRIGTEFELQGVRFRGTEECAPCHWMDGAWAPGAHEFLRGRGGLRAVILSDGALRVGAA